MLKHVGYSVLSAASSTYILNILSVAWLSLNMVILRRFLKLSGMLKVSLLCGVREQRYSDEELFQSFTFVV